MEEGEEMERIGEVPDELRCRRSDGKKWRCKRRVVGELKMCAYHLYKSNAKCRVGKKEGGVGVDDGVKMSVEKMMRLDGEGCSVSASGRKRKLVKRYETDDDEGKDLSRGNVKKEGKDLSRGSVKKEGKDLSLGTMKNEGNVDVLLKKSSRDEVRLIVLGLECCAASSGLNRKPVKQYGEEDMRRGCKKKEGNVDVLSNSKNVKKDVQVVSMSRVALDEEMVPDHLRCIRTDGKRWRCSRRVKDGATMCEKHYLQGRLRQVRAVVPESLKLQRRDRLSLFKSSQVHVIKSGGGKKRRPVKWRQWSKFSETLDDALRKLQLKKSDTELQLLKAYLKKQAEKLEMQQQFAAREGYCQQEVMKDLPFGAMTIAASPASQLASVAGTSSNIKIGSDPDSLSGVTFRSKNIEPVPVGSSKVMPGVKELVKLKREKQRCHMCSKLGSHLAKCSTCKKESFCMECIKSRYSKSRNDVEKACPVCCHQCSCEACVLNQSKDAEHQDSQNDARRIENAAHARKLIYMLFPVLKRIQEEQRLDLEPEANSQGKEHCEKCIQLVENGCKEQSYCENCKSSNSDIERSLNCSLEVSKELMKDVDTLLSNYFDKTVNTRRLCCELTARGGHDLLGLKRIFMSKWIDELEEGAEKTVANELHLSPCFDIEPESETVNQMQPASSRKNSSDNFLYCPLIKDDDLLDNFHKHWQKHCPIIVRNVLHPTDDLSWDPIFFFCSYLEKCRADSLDDAEVEASNCSNWCEVEIGIRQSYLGQSKGWKHASLWDETLKFKGCLSSYIFQNKFPDHYEEIIQSLPHQEYMNPSFGRLNLAVNLPPEVKPDLGPYVHISYGLNSDSVDSMGMLCYNSYDSVNIMVLATEVSVTSEQVTKIGKLMEKKWSEYQEMSRRTACDVTSVKKKGNVSKKGGIPEGVDISKKFCERVTACEGESGESCNSIVMQEPSGRNAANVNRHKESGSDSEDSNLCSQKSNDQMMMRNVGNIDAADDDDDSPSVSCGAEWDVFRREDIPSLLDYLKRHSNELEQPSDVFKNGAQPVLGQSVFLDAKDKFRLKDEFNIEPWTFKQRVGEAVIIPAGCPYQIRTLKSCSVSVSFDFISPESASSSVDLSKDLKFLSDGHVSNKDKLEVKQMVLYNISAALQQLSEI